jgi:hypothetical protein
VAAFSDRHQYRGYGFSDAQLRIVARAKEARPGMTSLEFIDTQHRPHLTPVPLQRWHFTTLSPFLTRPLPSQFLHFCFFLMFGPLSLGMLIFSVIERIIALVRHILRQTTAKMI